MRKESGDDAAPKLCSASGGVDFSQVRYVGVNIVQAASALIFLRLQHLYNHMLFY
jgi:hypothetical protein